MYIMHVNSAVKFAFKKSDSMAADLYLLRFFFVIQQKC